jgi:Fur family ferric uptake transcriptional regulator
MSHHTWNYQDALRRAGYRVTPQRELIMDLVCAADGRLTAQELCEAARSRSPGLNPATVYRNLRFLTERHLLRAVEREGGTRYELAGPQASHHHLVCRRCGRELEIDEHATDDFFAHIERTYGFRVDEDHLLLRGACDACKHLD